MFFLLYLFFFLFYGVILVWLIVQFLVILLPFVCMFPEASFEVLLFWHILWHAASFQLCYGNVCCRSHKCTAAHCRQQQMVLHHLPDIGKYAFGNSRNHQNDDRNLDTYIVLYPNDGIHEPCADPIEWKRRGLLKKIVLVFHRNFKNVLQWKETRIT